MDTTVHERRLGKLRSNLCFGFICLKNLNIMISIILDYIIISIFGFS